MIDAQKQWQSVKSTTANMTIVIAALVGIWAIFWLPVDLFDNWDLCKRYFDQIDIVRSNYRKACNERIGLDRVVAVAALFLVPTYIWFAYKALTLR